MTSSDGETLPPSMPIALDAVLNWVAVDDCHQRAAPCPAVQYDIIHTPDGQVSWQGPWSADWEYVASVEAAKSSALADFQLHSPTVPQ